ncbi:MAG: anti-sigma factor [Bacteroidota bacterium]|nr:anti-sigma factor [Bacteroidota bacterium]
MNVKDIISSGLLELYITGLTSDEETLQVEKWAEQHAEVKKEIEDLQQVMENYAMAEAIDPDESLKEKILSKIQPGESVKEKIFSRIQSPTAPTEFSSMSVSQRNEDAVVYKMPSYFKWAAAACIILLLGSIVLAYTFYNKYHNASSNYLAAQSELQKQQQIADAMHKDMDVVTNKYAQPVVLNGTEHSPNALAKIFWMKNTGDVYVDPTNLPETPSGKQYQLWAIVDGKPVDAGMITTQKGVYHIQKMKSFGKAQAFAITLEKSGGSPTPTMDQMIVQAKI